jgi:hypothetical protein
MVLTIAPGRFLRHHATSAAIHTALGVEEEHQKAPERDELEAPLGQMIVTPALAGRTPSTPP